MTALPSQPEQAEGLNHRNRGQHARVRPRKITSLEPLRPERALQPLGSIGFTPPSQTDRGSATVPVAAFGVSPNASSLLPASENHPKSRVGRTKSRVDLGREPLIHFENYPEPHDLPALGKAICPTITRNLGLSNRFQTASNRKIQSVFIRVHPWLKSPVVPCSFWKPRPTTVNLC